MTLRRMSLTGDAMAHAIFPGAAIAYLISGLSLFGLTVGGTLAGLVVVALAGWVARSSHLKEDTSLAAARLVSSFKCELLATQPASATTTRPARVPPTVSPNKDNPEIR